MNLVLSQIENKNIWDSFAAKFPSGYFLQSWDWGEVNKELGNQIYRFGIQSGNTLVGICLGILLIARKGPFHYKSLIIPGGPLLDYTNKDLLNEVFTKLRVVAKKEGADFIRVRPPILDTAETADLFKSLGFRNAPMHLHAETTLELDLNQSEEDILKQMRKTTRYSIRKAEKDGIRVYSTADPAAAELIFEQQKETVARNKFAPFPKKYFESQLRHFGANGEASLFVAKYQGESVATALIVFFGKTAVYHLGASSNKHRALTASHLVQWEAIKESKRKGCNRYNFWGIIEEENKKHPWYGLSVFKRGFGGEVVSYLHAQDLPLSFKYPTIYVFESLRRKMRGL